MVCALREDGSRLPDPLALVRAELGRWTRVDELGAEISELDGFRGI